MVAKAEWLPDPRRHRKPHQKPAACLYFSAFAAILVNILRRTGLRGAALVAVRPDTIHVHLFNLAGRIKVTVCKIRLPFASAFPLQGVFMQALARLRAAPMRILPR